MNWHLKLSNVQSVSLGNNGGFSPSSYPTRNSGKFVPLPGILPSRVEAENYRRKSTETAGSAILASSLEFFFFFLPLAKVALPPSYFILLSQGAAGLCFTNTSAYKIHFCQKVSGQSEVFSPNSCDIEPFRILPEGVQFL